MKLSVVVRVRVDESRAHNEPGGVEALFRRFGDAAGRADGDESAVSDPDIADVAGRAGAVDDRAAGDQMIEHDGSLLPRMRIGCRRTTSVDGPHLTGRQILADPGPRLKAGPQRRTATERKARREDTLAAPAPAPRGANSGEGCGATLEEWWA